MPHSPRLRIVELDEVRDAIRPGLEAIRRRDPELPDIDAILQEIEDDHQIAWADDVFFVWHVRERDGVRVLWIWLAYGTGGGVIDRYEAELADLGRVCGCKKVMLESARMGYLRKMRRHPQWRLARVTLERDL